MEEYNADSAIACGRLQLFNEAMLDAPQSIRGFHCRYWCDEEHFVVDHGSQANGIQHFLKDDSQWYFGEWAAGIHDQRVTKAFGFNPAGEPMAAGAGGEKAGELYRSRFFIPFGENLPRVKLHDSGSPMTIANSNSVIIALQLLRAGLGNKEE
jgi:hypothetical protein